MKKYRFVSGVDEAWMEDQHGDRAYEVEDLCCASPLLYLATEVDFRIRRAEEALRIIASGSLNGNMIGSGEMAAIACDALKSP